MAKKILFISQEIAPYVPETEVAVMGRDLPHKVQEQDFETRMFMPRWGEINERRGQLHEVIRLSGMNLIIDDTDHPLIIKVASIPTTRLQVYFIDNDDFFSKRGMATNEDGQEYDDNGQRAIFFARGVLETVKKLRWVPDVIVCQGWMSSVVPIYVKTAYKDEPSFAGAKVVSFFSGDELKQPWGEAFKKNLVFKDAKAALLKKYSDEFDYNELMKLSLDYSDGAVVAAKGHEAAADYANTLGLPTLVRPAEGEEAAYGDFFNKLCGE